MAIVCDSVLETYNSPKKCGEILLSADKGEVSLHCLFCEKVFKKIGPFVNHIKLQHSNDWNKTVAEKQEILESTIEIVETPEILQAIDSTQNLISIKEEDNPLELNDNSQDAAPTENKFEVQFQSSSFSDNDDIVNDNSNLGFEENSEDSEHKLSFDLNLNPISDSDSENSEYKPTEYSSRKKDLSSRSKDVVFQLINEMQSHENIWDNSNPDYHSKNMRKSSYDAIVDKLRTKFPEESITKDYVQLKVRELIRVFHKSEEGKMVCGSKVYYDRLQFLRGRSQKKETGIYKPNDAGDYECSFCAKLFQKRSYLVEHLRRHRKEYHYKCEVCSRPFYKTTALRQHMLVHTREKPHICEMCGKAFRILWQLQRHIRHHFKERDFKCHLCPKTYFRKDNLATHLKTHAKVPPETCDECGKNFYTKQNLKQHKKLHSDIKEYICHLCNKGFAQASGRSSHIRRSHKSLTPIA